MRQLVTEEAAIAAEIARIRSLALDALRRGWRAEFGRTPPTGLSRDLLGRMIAWRLQERAFGGLDRDSLAFLDRLARQSGSRRRQLKPRTGLVREDQGQRHTVTVCCSSHRQRAYELRRARAQMQGETPMLLLGRDVDTMQTKESIKRAVVEVLRELGFLEGVPKRPPPLRLVEKKTED